MMDTAFWAIASALLSVVLSIPVGIWFRRKYEMRTLNREITMAENILTSIERLSKLHRLGELTEDEWNEQKRILLYWPSYLNTRSRLRWAYQNTDGLAQDEVEVGVLIQDGQKISEFEQRIGG